MFQMLKSLIQDNTWKTRLCVGELHCYYYYAIAGFKLMTATKIHTVRLVLLLSFVTSLF